MSRLFMFLINRGCGVQDTLPWGLLSRGNNYMYVGQVPKAVTSHGPIQTTAFSLAGSLDLNIT
jgi:hypothetical protein